LVLWFDVSAYHALPCAGGLRDQPAGLWRRMKAAGNVYTLWRTYIREPHKATWMQEHPEHRATVKAIWESLQDG